MAWPRGSGNVTATEVHVDRASRGPSYAARSERSAGCSPCGERRLVVSTLTYLPTVLMAGLVAQGGFFSRLGNLWGGFWSLWVGDIEKRHPEIAYENSINSLIEKHHALKKATAMIIRRREELEGRLEKAQKELAQTVGDLETAVETNQDDLALILINRQGALESQIADLEVDLDQARHDADDAKSSLLSVAGEISKLKAEKDQMLAKMKSAEARIQVQEQLDGLSVDAEVKALDNVREHIEGLSAQAKLNAELKGQSLEGRLEKLRVQTGEVTARKKLEELKAKRLAAKSQQAQKTM